MLSGPKILTVGQSAVYSLPDDLAEPGQWLLEGNAGSVVAQNGRHVRIEATGEGDLLLYGILDPVYYRSLAIAVFAPETQPFSIAGPNTMAERTRETYTIPQAGIWSIEGHGAIVVPPYLHFARDSIEVDAGTVGPLGGQFRLVARMNEQTSERNVAVFSVTDDPALAADSLAVQLTAPQPAIQSQDGWDHLSWSAIDFAEGYEVLVNRTGIYSYVHDCGPVREFHVESEIGTSYAVRGYNGTVTGPESALVNP